MWKLILFYSHGTWTKKITKEENDLFSEEISMEGQEKFISISILKNIIS